MIFLVFRKEVWQSNETMRLIGIFIPNDFIHGYSAIRASFSSLCSHWYFPAGFNPMHWPSLHFLLNHRWNEGSSCDRRFPGNYLISLSQKLWNLIVFIIQSILMFASVYCVIVKGAIDVGGLGGIWRIADEGGRLEFFKYEHFLLYKKIGELSR
jgi:hypothetical protein